RSSSGSRGRARLRAARDRPRASITRTVLLAYMGASNADRPERLRRPPCGGYRRAARAGAAPDSRTEAALPARPAGSPSRAPATSTRASPPHQRADPEQVAVGVEQLVRVAGGDLVAVHVARVADHDLLVAGELAAQDQARRD